MTEDGHAAGCRWLVKKEGRMSQNRKDLRAGQKRVTEQFHLRLDLALMA